MTPGEKVKVDSSYVNCYLEKNGISKSDFSVMNGHSRSWWRGIESRCDCKITPNQAKLICSVTGLDYEKLVIPEHTTSNAPQNAQKSILEEDETLLKALVNCMNRIEKKMDEATIDLTRLEIQMRTVLKEMGVK